MLHAASSFALPLFTSSASLPPKTLTISSPLHLSFHLQRQQTHKKPTLSSFCRSAPPTDAAFPSSASLHQQHPEAGDEKWDASQCEALLRGGEQVTSVLQDMLKLLEDMDLDEATERVAVEIAAQGVIGKRVDEMESGFMMAIDYMIRIAEKDNDDQRKTLLEVIKQTVLDHLAKKSPPYVQVVGLLCQTAEKESRHELLRRVAAGGGVFNSEKGLKVHLPGANLNDIANQADDLLETMESRPTIPDRKLLARLVLVREEARNMMGGGLLDERNDRGLSTLPVAEELAAEIFGIGRYCPYTEEGKAKSYNPSKDFRWTYTREVQNVEVKVNFLTKLVSLRPGRSVEKIIRDVIHGKNEGADNGNSDSELNEVGGAAERESVTGRKPRPVRPGMFLETVSKVLGGIYSGNISGITAQHLEWVHQKTLQILQEMAY